MRFPDAPALSHAPFLVLLAKEIRDLIAGRAFWVLLLLLCPLVGYGLEQAMLLFAEASRSAAQSPELARGLSPFDGVVVPTFGALYLATTFLFPFVAIRTIGAEKQDGAHKLMQQLPYGTPAILAAKVAVLAFAWALMAAACLSALLLWGLQGGHLSVSEVAIVLLGHALYAAIVVGIALAAAAIAESSATAAVIALSVTLGFWVLDFAAAGDAGLLKTLSGLSLTAVLRAFEHGIFSLGSVLATLAVACGLVALAGVWWPTGHRAITKSLATALVLLLAGGAVLAASRVAVYIDATEDGRNSFSEADAAALKRLGQKLTVTVNLRSEDPRYTDFSKDVLGKLVRTVPDIAIIETVDGRSELFTPGDESYGRITLGYAGRKAETRSTSANEILPLVYELAGLEPPQPTSSASYPGYPLVADPRPARIWFYVVLPIVIAAGCLAASGHLHRFSQTVKAP